MWARRSSWVTNLCFLFPRKLHMKLASMAERFKRKICLKIMVIYMYIARGKGQTTPWVTFFQMYNFSVNLVICSKIFPYNYFIIVFPSKRQATIRSCHKIGQGQPRIIIYINFVEVESPMLYAKFKIIGFSVLENTVLKVFTIYWHGSHLGHVTWTIQLLFLLPMEEPYDIWLQLAKRFRGRRSLKIVDNGRPRSMDIL